MADRVGRWAYGDSIMALWTAVAGERGGGEDRGRRRGQDQLFRERALFPLRALVVVVNLLGWLALRRAPGALPPLAWGILAVTIVRLMAESIATFRALPVSERVLRMSVLLDQASVLGWVASTGGTGSPFADLLFLGVVASTRLAPTQAAASLVLYVIGSLALVGAAHLIVVSYLAILGAGLFIALRRTERDRWMADVDGLTGAFNHRYTRERLDAELAAARQSGGPCALLFVDVDGFKLFNDTYGHPAGDTVLRSVAQRLRQACPPAGVLGRLGGDEFAVILPRTGRDGALAAGERMRAAVEQVDLRPGDRVRIPFTVSAGAAVFPDDAQAGADLLDVADRALYQAKRAGGNAVTTVDTETHRAIAAYGATLGALQSLAVAVEHKDHNTASHTDHVSRLAVLVGHRLGLSDEDQRQLRIGAVMHDVGKIGVPDEILRKPGPLTPEEEAVMRGHPEFGYMLLKEMSGLGQVLDIVRHHHERFDGAGYPDGLRGEEIGLLARIVSAVDAFTAMTADRPYRRRLPHGVAIKELERCAGSQFDPAVVDALVTVLRDEAV